MTASVTRTTSVAIIVFEMGVQLSQMVPVLLAVLVSYLISNQLSIGIFDVLLEMKQLPYLPSL